MGLVGHFPENELFVYFRWLIQDFSRSASLFFGKPLPQKVFLNIAWGGIYNYCCAFGPRQVILRSCLFFLPLRFFCCFTDFMLYFFFSFCLSSFVCLLILCFGLFFVRLLFVSLFVLLTCFFVWYFFD